MNHAEKVRIVQVEEEYHELFFGAIKIGYAELYTYPDTILIDNIEFLQDYQGMGYGKAIVDKLKETIGVSSLTGDSVPEALQFWAKMGAVFNSSELDNLEDDEDKLIGFKIPCGFVA